jgi:uncharacterized lipoprotein YajG
MLKTLTAIAALASCAAPTQLQQVANQAVIANVAIYAIDCQPEGCFVWTVDATTDQPDRFCETQGTTTTCNFN